MTNHAGLKRAVERTLEAVTTWRAELPGGVHAERGDESGADLYFLAERDLWSLLHPVEVLLAAAGVREPGDTSKVLWLKPFVPVDPGEALWLLLKEARGEARLVAQALRAKHWPEFDAVAGLAGVSVEDGGKEAAELRLRLRRTALEAMEDRVRDGGTVWAELGDLAEAVGVPRPEWAAGLPAARVAEMPPPVGSALPPAADIARDRKLLAAVERAEAACAAVKRKRSAVDGQALRMFTGAEFWKTKEEAEGRAPRSEASEALDAAVDARRASEEELKRSLGPAAAAAKRMGEAMEPLAFDVSGEPPKEAADLLRRLRLGLEAELAAADLAPPASEPTPAGEPREQAEPAPAASSRGEAEPTAEEEVEPFRFVSKADPGVLLALLTFRGVGASIPEIQAAIPPGFPEGDTAVKASRKRFKEAGLVKVLGKGSRNGGAVLTGEGEAQAKRFRDSLESPKKDPPATEERPGRG